MGGGGCIESDCSVHRVSLEYDGNGGDSKGWSWSSGWHKLDMSSIVRFYRQ